MVGGWHIRTLDTTELLTPGAPRWQDSGKLPSARYGLRAATVDNKVVVTGNNQYGVPSVQLCSFRRMSFVIPIMSSIKYRDPSLGQCFYMEKDWITWDEQRQAWNEQCGDERCK